MNFRHIFTRDPSQWVVAMSGLKEVRDVLDATFLSQPLIEFNKENLERITDLIAMRICEVRQAKAPGNSREKAEALSPTAGTGASSQTQMSDGAFIL